jgi:uncharacterized protein with PIN domain
MNDGDEPPRLCADRMLMRLGRWLRFLGYDVLIPEEMDDAELIAEARGAGALLLTRDQGIVARKGVDALLVESVGLEDQLRQVVTALGMPEGEAAMSRCSLCNTVLDTVPSGGVGELDLADEPPENVLVEYDEFWHCPACRKLYWRGSHYDRILKTIDDLR